jgi:protein-disulfide isomerase
MKLAPFALAAALVLPALTATGPEDVHGNTYGTAGAPILIEVYSDFECPGCKNFHDTVLPQMMRDFIASGKVYVIYRYFPLPGHPHSRQAAQLVAAAARVGKWQEAGDALFASQQTWSQNGKVQETVDAVLTPAEQKKVHALTSDPGVNAEIDHDLELGKAVPVPSTPTMVVMYKMRRYPISGNGIFNYALIKSFFDDLLKK